MDRLPASSKFYCHPGRAGGSPVVLEPYKRIQEQRDSGTGVAPIRPDMLRVVTQLCLHQLNSLRPIVAISYFRYSRIGRVKHSCNKTYTVFYT